MSIDSPIAALIVAAGRGARAGGEGPKQYRPIEGLPVLARTLRAFLAAEAIDRVLVVIHADDASLYEAALASLAMSAGGRLMPPVAGGATRQDSVRAGLECLAERGTDGLVLVHDAARPFVSGALIARAVAAGTNTTAAIPAVPVSDTIKRVDAAGQVVATPARAELVAVQTPQVFDLAALIAAHRLADLAGAREFTDDAAIMEWAGHAVSTFAGDPLNGKLTWQADFEAAERRLAGAMTTRVGTGYDVHAFGPGDHVWLGGVRIAHDQGVVAHSDGDVVLHALTDALLGTLADGDIGTHFPPSDPAWRGASSDRFLAFAVDRITSRGGIVDHLDVTIICEAPKVGPHREAIRTRIAAIARIAPGRVGVKATTSERLGFTGRREGLAALATATVRLPATED